MNAIKIPRDTALALLLRPLAPRDPSKPMHPGDYELAVVLRITEVYGALPFLDDSDQWRARGWLQAAESLRSTFKGRLAWQADPARH